MQPTNEQLEIALKEASLDKTKLCKLVKLRNARTTWAFAYELSLRKDIDKFLSNKKKLELPTCETY